MDIDQQDLHALDGAVAVPVFGRSVFLRQAEEVVPGQDIKGIGLCTLQPL